MTIPLLLLQISDLYAVPTILHESLNEQNRMSEHIFPNILRIVKVSILSIGIVLLIPINRILTFIIVVEIL